MIAEESEEDDEEDEEEEIEVEGNEETEETEETSAEKQVIQRHSIQISRPTYKKQKTAATSTISKDFTG